MRRGTKVRHTYAAHYTTNAPHVVGEPKNGELRMENGKCGSRQIERSVIRQRAKLAAIRSFADSALTITEPLDDGSFLNLGATYKGLSASIAAIREFCGPSIVECK